MSRRGASQGWYAKFVGRKVLRRILGSCDMCDCGSHARTGTHWRRWAGIRDAEESGIVRVHG